MKLLLVGCLLAAAAAVLSWRLSFDAPAEGGLAEGRFRNPALVAVDSTGHGHDGVNQGGPIQGVPGHKGTAYSFDPRGSWIQVASSPELNPGRRNFLFSAWVSFTTAPDLGETFDIVRKGITSTSSGEFKVEIVPGGHVRCSAKDSEREVATITGPDNNLADGRWHRIGCARTGSTWSVIVDRTVQSKTVELGSVGNTVPLSIGSKYGLEDSPRDGLVDEVSLFVGRAAPTRATPTRLDRARAQIKRLRVGTPVARWHLDETRSAPDPTQASDAVARLGG